MCAPQDIARTGTTHLTVNGTTKRAKKQKTAKIDAPMEEPSSCQAIGQSLSLSLLATINATQANFSTAIHNLGQRPSTRDSRSLGPSGFSSSCSTLGCIDDEPITPKPAPPKKRATNPEGSSYNLRDFAALDVIETLLSRHGTASHMGVRDPSYTFFVNESRTGALCYKLLDNVAVITGDPLCYPTQFSTLLEEFRLFCKAQDWSVALMAASTHMAALAQEKKWVTMKFARERSINPMSNPLLLGKGGKRTVAKCRQLLKSGMDVKIYCPSYQHDHILEGELTQLYDDWRAARNTQREVQAFMTVFDMLALPRLMTYLYIRDGKSGNIIGLAALRKIAHDGFHVDPVIASEVAPKGTTDLLLFSAMAFCNVAGISKLSLGFEPKQDLNLEDITGMPSSMAKATRKVHQKMWADLPLEGKKTFHDRWHTDDEQNEDLYIIFMGMPKLRHMLAMLHLVNIRLKTMIVSHVKKEKDKNEGKGKSEDRNSSDAKNENESRKQSEDRHGVP